MNIRKKYFTEYPHFLETPSYPEVFKKDVAVSVHGHGHGSVVYMAVVLR